MTLARTPLSRGATTNPDGSRRYSTFSGPRKPLGRSTPKRSGTDRDDPAYRKFVREMPCIHCGRPGPSEAAHMTLGPDEKGIGLKVPDRQCVPLCHGDHRAWDTNAAEFKHMSREDRWRHAAIWVEETQKLAIPGDDFDMALELEARGLGTILKQVHGPGFAWLAGPQEGSK